MRKIGTYLPIEYSINRKEGKTISDAEVFPLLPNHPPHSLAVPSSRGSSGQVFARFLGKFFAPLSFKKAGGGAGAGQTIAWLGKKQCHLSCEQAFARFSEKFFAPLSFKKAGGVQGQGKRLHGWAKNSAILSSGQAFARFLGKFFAPLSFKKAGGVQGQGKRLHGWAKNSAI